MISVIVRVVVLALASMLNVADGQEAGRRASLSATILAGGLLKPNERQAERTLIVDTSRQVAIVVTSTADLKLSLILPDGSVLTRSDANKDRLQWQLFTGNGAEQGLVMPGAGSGFNTLMTLASPAVGRYTVRLDRTEDAAEPVPFLVTLTADSDLRMGLTTPYSDAVRGGPFVVCAVLFDQDRPVRGAKVTAHFTRTDADPAAVPIVLRELTLTDDARNGDAVRGDGIYTGIVAAKSSGRHWIAVRATGSNRAGVPFERNAGTTFLASEPSVQITKVGTVEWVEGRDRRISELRVPIELLGPAGEYETVVTLRAKNGRQADGNQLIRIDARQRAQVKVSIDAARIKLLGVDGPYHVQATEVYELANQDRVLRARRIATEQTPALRLKDLRVP